MRIIEVIRKSKNLGSLCHFVVLLWVIMWQRVKIGPCTLLRRVPPVPLRGLFSTFKLLTVLTYLLDNDFFATSANIGFVVNGIEICRSD